MHTIASIFMLERIVAFYIRNSHAHIVLLSEVKTKKKTYCASMHADCFHLSLMHTQELSHSTLLLFHALKQMQAPYCSFTHTEPTTADLVQGANLYAICKNLCAPYLPNPTKDKNLTQ
jgi:hypothetical protein